MLSPAAHRYVRYVESIAVGGLLIFGLLTYYELNQLAPCRDAFQAAIDIRTELLPPLHPELAISYANLGNVEAAKGKPIASLFELPKRGSDSAKLGKVKTEILFIERCLALLQPGG